MPYLGQQLFKIQNGIKCCLKKDVPVFSLKLVFQPKNDFPCYILLKIKSTKCSALTYFISLSVIFAITFIMVKPNAILKLEPVSISVSLPKKKVIYAKESACFPNGS